jgi:hypothetical protein
VIVPFLIGFGCGIGFTVIAAVVTALFVGEEKP